MKLLVLSDIHAFSKERENGGKPSYVRSGDTDPEVPTNAFLKMLDEGRIERPDLIACPGDLCDQADRAGLTTSWTFLQKLAAYSTSNQVLATAGNHDLDSRFKTTTFDSKGALLTLSPAFPLILDPGSTVDFERLGLEFWARNFFLFAHRECRFVVLNTCAYHGGGIENSELRHGRISKITLGWMFDALAKSDAARKAGGHLPYALNILLCHHHVQKDGSIDDADDSLMVGAHALVDKMSEGAHGRWFVIHGHRHRARMFQTGGVSGPLVLSSASFSATKDKDYENASPNQAHLIDFDFQAATTLGFSPAGQIKTWTFQPGLGWLHEGYQGGGLPPTTSFGYLGSLDKLAGDIASMLHSKPFERWPAICQQHPEASYLAYDQIKYLKARLSSHFNIDVSMGTDGLPIECGSSA